MKIIFDDVQKKNENVQKKIEAEQWYFATINNVQEMISKNDKKYWLVIWNIDNHNQTIYDSIFFTSKALPRFMFLLEAIEIPVLNNSIEIETNDLLYQKCEIFIVEENWEGKKGLKISWDGFRKTETAPNKTNKIQINFDDEEEKVPF